MGRLSIIQYPTTDPGLYRLTLKFESDGQPTRLASADFLFTFPTRDREDVRWYLEDYLDFSEEPAPRIAERVERRMAELGEHLFRSIFRTSDEARALWEAARSRIADTRVEITSGFAEATSIPWELLRDPETQMWLAMGARSFVRSGSGLLRTPAEAHSDSGIVRVLLVICRPRGGADVPFRSVARHIVAALGRGTAFKLDVLRPPTYHRLCWTLRKAKQDKIPYHIAHFDGHGTYGERSLLAMDSGAGDGSAPKATSWRDRRGFLVFEKSEADRAGDGNLVDGHQVGALLQETGVPVLVLNACQSAFAQPSTEPGPAKPGVDMRKEVEAYGSFAQEVLGASSAAGVVAMQYSVRVSTAARFVAELYEALAQGQTLGNAVGQARKLLAKEPERQVGFRTLPLQDWSVPVVWEGAPLRLWPETDRGSSTSDRAVSARAVQEAPQLGPGSLEAEFVGRDETLYALDRAFDDGNRVVLLHAYAGAGKTATAREFSRWYKNTGGINTALAV